MGIRRGGWGGDGEGKLGWGGKVGIGMGMGRGGLDGYGEGRLGWDERSVVTDGRPTSDH